MTMIADVYFNREYFSETLQYVKVHKKQWLLFYFYI